MAKHHFDYTLGSCSEAETIFEETVGELERSINNYNTS